MERRGSIVEGEGNSVGLWGREGWELEVVVEVFSKSFVGNLASIQFTAGVSCSQSSIAALGHVDLTLTWSGLMG